MLPSSSNVFAYTPPEQRMTRLIFHQFNLIYFHLYKMHNMHLYFLVQLQFSAIISQYRPRVIFKYTFWKPEECVRPNRQAIMYTCIPASSYCSKIPAKIFPPTCDVTIITSTHVVINYHYHNQKTRGKVDNRPSNDPQVPKSELY